MEYLGPAVIVLLVGTFLSVVVFAMRHQRKLAAGREELAARRGWRHAAGGGHRIVYTLEGEEGGAAWRVECRRGQKNSSGRTSFLCRDAAAGGGVVYLGSAGIGALLNSGVGRTFAGWAMGIGGALGADVGPLKRLVEHSVEVDFADPAFAERFSVLTTDESLARRVLTGRAREALLAWSPPGGGGPRSSRALSVTWSDDGMSLSWPDDLLHPESMASFVELGITLASEARAGW